MKINGTSWGDFITPWSLFQHSTSHADSIDGNGGWDLLSGGGGNDSINGNGGNDVLYGDAGNDQLKGGSGDDWLFGGAGRDNLNGGSGRDLLNGGSGADVLTGGAGDDSFVFDTKLSSSNVDDITDFRTGHDHIVLNPLVMTALWPGSLQSGQFYAHAGAVAGHDATDRIIYDTASGKLYYDADGSGSHAAVQFAVLSGHATLHGSDFLIV